MASRLEEAGTSTSTINSITMRICRICHVMEHCTQEARKRRPIVHKASDQGFGAEVLLMRLWSHFGLDELKPLLSFLHKDRATNSETEGCADDEEEMISPCECRGTMEFVHRGCLNQWRTASSRIDSFTRCEQCNTPYQFRESFLSRVLLSPLFLRLATMAVLGAWIVASLVITGNGNALLLNVLPEPASAENIFAWLLDDSLSLTIAAWTDRIVSALVFMALTEFIFLGPSFVFAFNLLFCIWRIHRYSLTLDVGLLFAFTAVGVWRAGQSTHTLLNDCTNRLVKLRLLQVISKNKYD